MAGNFVSNGRGQVLSKKEAVAIIVASYSNEKKQQIAPVVRRLMEKVILESAVQPGASPHKEGTGKLDGGIKNQLLDGMLFDITHLILQDVKLLIDVHVERENMEITLSDSNLDPLALKDCDKKKQLSPDIKNRFVHALAESAFVESHANLDADLHRIDKFLSEFAMRTYIGLYDLTSDKEAKQKEFAGSLVYYWAHNLVLQDAKSKERGQGEWFQKLVTADSLVANGGFSDRALNHRLKEGIVKSFGKQINAVLDPAILKLEEMIVQFIGNAD